MRGICAAWLLVLVGGCGLYDSEDALARCDDQNGAPYDPASVSLRNPQTGECQVMSGGVREACDDGNGFAPEAPGGALPDWGSCSSYCDGLAETQCLAADGCRAVYVAYPTAGPSGGVRAFAACWATAPSGPLRGGVCEGLDAQECSRYDDCSAVHEDAGSGVPGTFRSCVYETICEPGYDQPSPLLRNPQTGACELGAGGGGVDPCVDGFGAPPAPLADWGQCGSACEAYDEITCRATDGCRPILGETCAPWLDCPSTTGFIACWPIAPSGPTAPGGCDGLDAYGCSLHNDCAAEHLRDWSACGPTTPGCVPTTTSFVACHAETP
jgi:hypothetical protein